MFTVGSAYESGMAEVCGKVSGAFGHVRAAEARSALCLCMEMWGSGGDAWIRSDRWERKEGGALHLGVRVSRSCSLLHRHCMYAGV